MFLLLAPHSTITHWHYLPTDQQTYVKRRHLGVSWRLRRTENVTLKSISRHRGAESQDQKTGGDRRTPESAL